MNLKQLLLVSNACYKAGRTIVPKGIMVHSTGANNPNLKRYVGPDDGLLGKNQYNNHWNQPNPGGRQVCVHAFIGKMADGSIATYQTLPWNHRGWHGGGSSNNTHISFEICEDSLTDGSYFAKVYTEAVELCAYLCKMYGLTEGDIICHCEGYRKGIASNHADVLHWFPKHGKNMDTFRADVKKLLAGGSTPEPTPEPTPTPTPGDGSIVEGSLVEIKGDTKRYYPGSKEIPGWAKTDFYHRVTQTTVSGKAVTKGKKTCVLLGKKVKKAGGAEEAGIYTWVAVDYLSVVGSGGSAAPGETSTYTIKKGDSLWGIAQTFLGNGARYKEIQSLNGLSSDLIKTGQVLKIPAK